MYVYICMLSWKLLSQEIHISLEYPFGRVTNLSSAVLKHF